jgi:hypothetical protein
LSTDILSLSERNVKRLGTDHLAVHLGNSFGRLVGRRVADETEVLGDALVILHDSAAGDGSEWVELGSKTVVIPLVIQVLDVKVHTGRLGLVLETLLLVALSQLFVSLGSLLSSADKELLALPFGLIERIDSLLGRLVIDKVYETESLALALFILAERGGYNISEWLDELFKLCVGSVRGDVFDKHVGEVTLELLGLGLSLLLADVVSDKHLLVVEQHAVDSLDGGSGGFTSGEVYKGESSRFAGLVSANLARKDVTEGSKSVV